MPKIKYPLQFLLLAPMDCLEALSTLGFAVSRMSAFKLRRKRKKLMMNKLNSYLSLKT
jgi:hypothetical protein